MCVGFALAATLCLLVACRVLARSCSSTVLGAECSDVSDAGNSPCFSLQPPSNTNFDVVLLCFPQGWECASKQGFFRV